MFKKLRTVIYRTQDLGAAKEWYTRLLDKGPYFDQPYYVGFDISGCELGLDPSKSELEKKNQTVAYWSVDDIEASLKKLEEAGATIRTAVQDVGEGIKVATVDDPWGNAVGLIQMGSESRE